MNSKDAVFVAGHRGLVGGALYRRLQALGYTKLITATHRELDLTEQAQVREFFARRPLDYVFVAAAKVGGIQANNTLRADFIYQNLMIEANLIHAAHVSGVKKLLFLGSSCIYPKLAPQPLREEHLLTGELEPTNEPYAVAKIAGIKLCDAYRAQYGRDFISAMPTNLYGPGDNFDLEHSHVIPALMRRLHEAKLAQAPQVVIWGSGAPRREFLFVDDLAEALVFMMDHFPGPGFLNVGVGTDVSIAELAELIRQVVGYPGELVYDSSKPDGTPQKLLDVSRLAELGWRASTSLTAGLERTYDWFLVNYEHMRGK
ncbi:MAG: GDP-L-fucose synthase [Deltaproteobacteria bacterium]|nr:GDP-L-fucose synthase [Deltaproteobacteria bacterium]